MTHRYMPTQLPKTAAKAMGKDLPISPKVSIEICNYLRGKEIDAAIATLERVKEKRQAIPYKRFANGAGHKPGKGMAAGRYPVKASGEFLKILRNAKANAANAGLSGTLIITHIAAQRANEPFRAYAKERITFKRAHLEVVLTEGVSKEAAKVARNAAKKPAAKKTETKTAEHKTTEHKMAEKKSE
nr:50S ribosomal protein L22P [uncultured archaeon]